MSSNPDDCAAVILDVVPMIMRFIRAEMRRHRAADLTIPQFRTLAFINRQVGASLFEVANHLGLTPPSTCKIVDELVSRTLISRQESLSDRRRVTLKLTPEGETLLKLARQDTQDRLAKILSSLSAYDRDLVTHALSMLHPVFAIYEQTLPEKELEYGNSGDK